MPQGLTWPGSRPNHPRRQPAAPHPQPPARRPRRVHARPPPFPSPATQAGGRPAAAGRGEDWPGRRECPLMRLRRTSDAAHVTAHPSESVTAHPPSHLLSRLDAARRLSALLVRVCAVCACSMAVREALRMAVDDAVTFSAPFVHQAPPPPPSAPPRSPRPAL